MRHYRPIRVLGSGGFGKTYLAEDVEKFNELCVIKQFAPQIQGTGALQKATELFEQEARRLQHLGEHPQIPTLFAYFEQDHRLYLVQQFIDRENLLDELQHQLRSPSEMPATVAYPQQTSPSLPDVRHSKSVMTVAISSDGQTLASGRADSTIKIWNLQTGELKNTLTGHQDVIFAVAISPDGKALASGSYDRTIKIWDLQTGALKNTLTEHRYAVSSLAISPDGQTLVSGSWDNTIKIWNLQTGALKTTLTGHSDLVYTVAISPDGQTLVSGTKDKTIKIWRVP
ncbi:hypothetical protein BV372_06670 [Nostoc sp. T09]|nr:WD40 repeat domain-containing serine/threonine-protein kinase [Nostoc sp. T09]OUL36640.1 hypothetical protein BV372_06670 [Nostoc sp. T09]